ncbi:hypothetical protein [Vibrio sp. SCSIO 43137]|uniref:hypothetical protein n=1 Tax=Vibrio sp. SCSIO 43137 TaxID=3021011 RepID=UPI002307A804|nr:hypothetical protein [Vibrio sp. SCSIO 43137]WCE28434.1 hypothetical protein PK654_08600 [Vibrio sp. SCSIO 43137]
MKTIGLFDADWIAFQMAAAVQQRVRWDDGLWTLELPEDVQQIIDRFYFTHQINGIWNIEVNENELYRAIDARVEQLRKDISCRKENVFMCISGQYNWRKDVMHTYKSNREALVNKYISRPIILDIALEYIRQNYQVLENPRLEADDIMGIYATDPEFYGDPDYRKVIVTVDKDLKSVPAWHYTPDKDFSPWLQSVEEADKIYYIQWLMGDKTDGYDGCKGIGGGTAASMVDIPFIYVETLHEFKSGARKGQTETRWKKEPTDDLAEMVKSAYLKTGHSGEYCYQNGMVARILRHGEYCFDTNKLQFKPQ